MDENARCPYCGGPLGRHHQSGEPLKTCGSHECHHAAIRAGIMKTYAARTPAVPQLGQYPWKSKNIDFQNGFASQNLTFAADRTRLRT